MMMHHAPEIAIIDANTLSAIGLQSVLNDIIPMAVIRTFSTFSELIDDTPDMYAHYFVSSHFYMEHTSFFLDRKKKTIVMGGEGQALQLSGVTMLNIYQSKDMLIKSILRLHQHAHHKGNPPEALPPKHLFEHNLSAREIDVLVQITKGLINKEIADKLNISLTTVITHRKNITDKLGIKSVSGLTIYAVMNGYVEADRI